VPPGPRGSPARTATDCSRFALIYYNFSTRIGSPAALKILLHSFFFPASFSSLFPSVLIGGFRRKKRRSNRYFLAFSARRRPLNALSCESDRFLQFVFVLPLNVEETDAKPTHVRCAPLFTFALKMRKVMFRSPCIYLFIYLYACSSHNKKKFKPNRMKFGGMIGYYPGTI